MADEGNLVSDVMTTPEQVLAAGGVSKRRRGASRRSPSGQRRRAPTPEAPKDLPIDADEKLELKSEISPTKPQLSPTKFQISSTKSQISPTKPEISPTKPEISPTKPEISPIKPQISPTKPMTVKRISTTEKTLVTKRSHSSPGENRQSLTSSVITSADVKQEPPILKSEEKIINTGDIPQSRTMVVKRKSTTEKTLVTKRSLSSPGEGRQSLPQSATTEDLKQETAVPGRRRLSHDADRIIGDGTSVTMVKKSPLNSLPPARTEDIVEIKTAVKEEKPLLSMKISRECVIVPKKPVESAQVPEVLDNKTPEVSIQKKPEEETSSSPPEDEMLAEKIEKSTSETEVEKLPLLSVKEDEKKIKEAVWGPFFREMWHEWKKFVAQNGEQWGKIISQRNRCIGALVVMIIYCGIGGLIFRFTEGAFEAFYKCGVKRVKRDFVDSLWLGSHNLLEDEWKSQARKKLMELENQLHAAHEAGVTTYSGQRAWSFLNAVVYCLTVVTTIGYGHISPTTTTGRAITIVYAIFGIPMFLILLADFGKLFTRGIKFVWAFVRRVYYTGSCKKVRRTVPVQAYRLLYIFVYLKRKIIIWLRNNHRTSVFHFGVLSIIMESWRSVAQIPDQEVMKGVQLVYDFATFRRPSQMVGESGEDGGKAPIADPEDLELQVPLNPQQQNQAQPPTTLPLDGHEPPRSPAVSTFEVDDEFNLPISVAIVILVIYIFVGATIYWTWENWGFFESFYFVFISMSTIGFGDFVPQHPMYMMASIVYLVFGLALTSMCINVVQEKLSDSFRQASAKLGATIGLRINEEGGAVTPIPPPQIELAEVHNTITKSHST